MKFGWLWADKNDIHKILMNQAEELAALKALTTQLGKGVAEIQDKIQKLNDAIANGEVSPEIASAVSDLTVAVQKVDDIVPDPVTSPVPPGSTPATP